MAIAADMGDGLQATERDLKCPPAAPNQLESYLSRTSLSCPSGPPSPASPVFTPAARNLSKKINLTLSLPGSLILKPWELNLGSSA